MTAMVQAQSLRGYRELVTDLGGNPTRLLRKAGIEPAALNQLTAFISFESLIDLLERSAADLGCPDFGLRLAERQDIGVLGHPGGGHALLDHGGRGHGLRLQVPPRL